MRALHVLLTALQSSVYLLWCQGMSSGSHVRETQNLSKNRSLALLVWLKDKPPWWLSLLSRPSPSLSRYTWMDLNLVAEIILPPHLSITMTAEFTECYEGQEGILLWGSEVVTNKCDIRQKEKSEGKAFVWRQQTGARQWQELAWPGSNGECTSAAGWSSSDTRTQRLLGIVLLQLAVGLIKQQYFWVSLKKL